MLTAFIASLLLAVIAAGLVTHGMIRRGKFLGECEPFTKAIFWLLFGVLAAVSIPVGFLYGGTFGGGIGALLGKMIGVFESQIGIAGVLLGICAVTFLLLESLVILLAALMTRLVNWHKARAS